MTEEKPRWLELLEKGRELSKQQHQPLPPPEEHAKVVAREVQEELFPQGKPPQEQARLPFAPLPSEMARCSPFFPLDKKSLGARPHLEKFVITKGPWGEITFTGQKLSTYDESVLLAVLALIDGQRDKEIEDVQGRPANAYSGPVLPILKLMGLTDGKANYARLIQSLDLLQACQIKLQTKKKIHGVGALVQYYSYEPGSHEIRIVLSPYFREMFSAGRVALLDVVKRASLPGEVSKALFRFIESHRARAWEGHVLTLAAALNLDLELESKRLRERIRKAIGELVKLKSLGRGSGIKGDIASLMPPKAGIRTAHLQQPAIAYGDKSSKDK